MKKRKEVCLLIGMLLMILLAGCGNENKKMSEGTEDTSVEETTEDLSGSVDETSAEEISAEETSVEKTSENLMSETETEMVDSAVDEEVEIEEETVPLINEGDSILFGKYEQDNDLENGEEDVEWTVLEMQDDSALLLSNKILGVADFNYEQTDSEGSLYWGNSDLHEWLNGTFYEQTFNEEEKEKIRPMHIVSGGIESVDNVFLLSRMEFKKFAGYCREAEPSRYAYSQGLEISPQQKGAYWLRTVADLEGYYTIKQIDVVDWSGNLIFKPMRDIKQYGVRPAIWISLAESNKEPIDSPFMEEESYVKKSEYVVERTDLEIGEKVIFGKDVSTPIEWWVVDVEEDGYILLGTYGDFPYNRKMDQKDRESIQSRLDETKYFEWFNEQERGMMVTQTDSDGQSRDIIFVTREEAEMYEDITKTAKDSMKIKVAFK